MARQGRIQREKSLKESAGRIREKRSLLSDKIVELETKKRSTSDGKVAAQCSKEIFAIMHYLQKTRGASYIRTRNRCQVTGRTRGYLRIFQMCRGVVRHLASFGLLNGVKKSSHS